MCPRLADRPRSLRLQNAGSERREGLNIVHAQSAGGVGNPNLIAVHRVLPSFRRRRLVDVVGIQLPVALRKPTGGDSDRFVIGEGPGARVA